MEECNCAMGDIVFHRYDDDNYILEHRNEILKCGPPNSKPQSFTKFSGNWFNCVSFFPAINYYWNPPLKTKMLKCPHFSGSSLHRSHFGRSIFHWLSGWNYWIKIDKKACTKKVCHLHSRKTIANLTFAKSILIASSFLHLPTGDDSGIAATDEFQSTMPSYRRKTSNQTVF